MESNEEIISRLKFIGLIQKDEKINVRHVNRQPNNWYTTVSRTILWPDNRHKCLKFIQDVINRSFQIVDQTIKEKDLKRAQMVLDDLKKSVNGMTNLKHTYIDDTKFCCDIDVLVQGIESKIGNYKLKPLSKNI